MKLSRYLKKKKITKSAFSRYLGIHRNHLTEIALERRNPGLALAKRIEEVTLGEVTVEDLICKPFNPKIIRQEESA